MPPLISLSLDEVFSVQAIAVQLEEASTVSIQGFINSTLVRQRSLQEEYRRAIGRSMTGVPNIGYSESLAKQKDKELEDVQNALCRASETDRESLIDIAKNLVHQNAIIQKLINFENQKASKDAESWML